MRKRIKIRKRSDYPQGKEIENEVSKGPRVAVGAERKMAGVKENRKSEKVS